MPKTKSSFDEAGTLLQATHRLLVKDKRSALDLHKQSGLPYFWLVQFKSKRSLSPSVDRVQFLYEFLSGRKLKV